jgi:TniQ
MNLVFAPAQLPVAPRPHPDEVLSSWLLRTAAANAISFGELLDSLHLRYPEAPVLGRMLDYSVPEITLQALSHFTRVPSLTLRTLDLNVRVPQLNPALLLRFPGHDPFRGHSLRLRYSFCPRCLIQQRRLHIRWDWCFAALIRCPVHRSALLDGCPHCGDVDSLNFSHPGARAILLCRCCSGDLTRFSEMHACLPDDDIIFVIETAYRSALHEIAPHPRLMDNATDRAFRRFVEDMLQLLVAVLSAPSEPLSALHTLPLSRRSLLAIVTELVRNATPTRDPARRNARYRHNLSLWSALFQVISERQGKHLESRAQHWPESLRRRFTTALEHRRRKRWPYNPYSSPMLSLRFKCRTLAAVFDLSATLGPQNAKSRI